MRGFFVEAGDGVGAGVVDGVGGAGDYVGVAGALGVGDGVVLYVAHQDLGAGADVVAGVPGKGPDVVEAAPDALVYLHDADAARLGAEEGDFAGVDDILAPAAFD